MARILLPAGAGALRPAGRGCEDAGNSRETGEAADNHLALAVADINWFTTESLFREIDRQSVSILALRCMDYVNGWRRGIYPWSSSCRPGLWGTTPSLGTWSCPAAG